MGRAGFEVDVERASAGERVVRPDLVEELPVASRKKLKLESEPQNPRVHQTGSAASGTTCSAASSTNTN